eukprot:m.337552 g.337552  ORF g.337552 m.337552 type:complete len:794 (+) comp18162_c0_seq1:157-2538(+)
MLCLRHVLACACSLLFFLPTLAESSEAKYDEHSREYVSIPFHSFRARNDFRSHSRYARIDQNLQKVQFTLQYKETNFQILVEPASHLVAHDARLWHISPSGEKTITSLREKAGNLYSGELLNHNASFVHLYVSLEEKMTGIIVIGNESYCIEPMHTNSRSGRLSRHSSGHVLYKERSITPQQHHGGAQVPMDFVNIYHEGDGHRKERAKVTASPYKQGKTVCHLALFADKSFVEGIGGKDAAMVIMLQRFSLANRIFGSSDFSDDGTAYPVKLNINRVIIDETAELEGNAPDEFLKSVSYRDTENGRDWVDVCLAHAFTFKDFEGVVGLAWTAFEKKENLNGGICQGQYTDPERRRVSLNTAFSSTLNFGAKQPELQSALVFVHELGHNFGSLHDSESDDKDESKGNYIMFPFAVTGSFENNQLFSPTSRASMAKALRDRGGCFLSEANSTICGNYIREVNETCDCGGDKDTCASLDKCCTASCELNFAVEAECSPLDFEHGFCCDSNCKAKDGIVCKEQSECLEAARCSTDGLCEEPQHRRKYSICEPGIRLCEAGQCAGLCNEEGKCVLSICELWGQKTCSSNHGSEACEIKCQREDDPQGLDCRSLAELGAPVLDSYIDNSTVATSDFYLAKVKRGGSTCEFEKGVPLSGLCTESGECVLADTEENLLGELQREFSQITSTLTDWLNEDTSGIPNYAWLAGGGFILLICCFGLCYVANNPNRKCCFGNNRKGIVVSINTIAESPNMGHDSPRRRANKVSPMPMRGSAQSTRTMSSTRSSAQSRRSISGAH